MIATMTIAAIRLLLMGGLSAYAINQPHSLALVNRDRRGINAAPPFRLHRCINISSISDGPLSRRRRRRNPPVGMDRHRRMWLKSAVHTLKPMGNRELIPATKRIRTMRTFSIGALSALLAAAAPAPRESPAPAPALS